MEDRQDFEVTAGDNPPVTFELTWKLTGQPLTLGSLSDLEWGLSASPGAAILDPSAVVTKRLSEGGIIVDDPDQAIVRLVLTTADLDIEPGRYVHQLRGVFVAGYRDTLARGTVTVEHSPL